MNFDSFENYINETIESWHCPGVSISITKESEVIYKRAFGFSDLQKQEPLTAESRFALGSVTKSFTAMSAAILVDEGLLAWDKPVCHYMPEFILADPYITRNVTVRDMLSHRTGLPRHDFAAWRLNVSRAEFINRMRYLKFSTTFREKYQYNNLMYIAVGYLVEKLAGQPWEDFVHSRILVPLGMTATNFEPTAHDKNFKLAEGSRIERDEKGQYKRHVPMPFSKHTALSPGPYGSIFSSLSDLTQWLKVHVNDGKCDGKQLVSPGNLKQIHSPLMIVPASFHKFFVVSELSMMLYGMGWMIYPYPCADGSLILHVGTIEGHSVAIGFNPESKAGVVVLTNTAACDVPSILLRDALDRVRGLPHQDWSKKFQAALDPLIAASEKGKVTSAEDKVGNAPPSHPLEAYVGIYSADGYPDFEVKLKNGQLVACTVGSLPWSDLHHYHYEVFELTCPAWNVPIKIKAKFLVNEIGEIGSVSIPLEPAVEDIVFVRKPVALDAWTLSEIVGDYETNVEGFTFNVTEKNGKLYWRKSGQSQQEATPIADRGNEIEFRVRRARLVFYKGNGRISHVVLKEAGGTYEGRKR